MFILLEGERHSTEVAFALLTQQPQVRIFAELFSFEIFLLNTA